MSDHTRRDDRRGAAVPHRPRAPARAGWWARTATLLEALASRCSRTRCSSARTSSASWRSYRAAPAAPLDRPLRRARPRARPGHGGRGRAHRGSAGRRLAVVVLRLVLGAPPARELRANEPGHPREERSPIVVGRAPDHEYSRRRVRADRSHRSGGRGPRRGHRALRRAARHARSSTARPWRSRASRPCCSAWATATSSCCSPLGPDTAVGKFLERSGPGLHHVAYGTDDIESALEPARRPASRLIDEQPRAGHPRQPRGVPAPEVDRRGAHRAGRARGGALMADDPTTYRHRLPGRPGAVRARGPGRLRGAPQGARRTRGRTAGSS